MKSTGFEPGDPPGHNDSPNFFMASRSFHLHDLGMITTDDLNGPGEEPVIPEIPEQDMTALFSLADWFLKTAPWQTMYDFHAIVIIDPDSGDQQLAVVLGNAGTVYAVHLYQPEEGTRWYSNIHRNQDSPISSHTAQFDNRYLEIEWSDGRNMDDHDTLLDDSFTPDHWITSRFPDDLDSVQFRQIKPGCPPWHPDLDGVKKMQDTLRLVRHYYENHFEEYEAASFSPDPEDESIELPTYTLPVGARRDDPSAWQFEMADFQIPGPKELPEVLPDDLFVARLDHFQVRPGTSWELGAIFAPQPMVCEGSLVYPVVAFVADRETSRAEGLRTVSSLTPRETLLRSSLQEAAEQIGYLPKEIVVGSPVAELALADLCRKKKIKVTPSAHPPLFSAIVEDLMKSPLFHTDDEEDLPTDFSPVEISFEDAEEMQDLIAQMPENASPEEAAAWIQKLCELPGADRLMDTILGQANLLEDLDGTPPKSPE